MNDKPPDVDRTRCPNAACDGYVHLGEPPTWCPRYEHAVLSRVALQHNPGDPSEEWRRIATQRAERLNEANNLLDDARRERIALRAERYVLDTRVRELETALEDLDLEITALTDLVQATKIMGWLKTVREKLRRALANKETA